MFSLWVSKFEKCSGCVCASGLPSFLHLCPRCPCFGEALVSPACQGLCFIQYQVIPVFLLHLGVAPLLSSGFAPFHAGPSITFDMLPLLSPVLSLLLSVPSPSAFYFCSPLAFAPPLPWPWPARRISPSTCPESARLASTTHLGGPQGGLGET